MSEDKSVIGEIVSTVQSKFASWTIDDVEKMSNWFKKHLPKETYGRGPNKKKIVDGFYKSAGATRKGKHIISTETVYKERRSGLNDTNKFRSYPCYSDITNPETIEWWLIYYHI